MTAVLEPGRTCAAVFEPTASGLLIDGHDFYKCLYKACLAAERSIVMAGWQFNANVELVRGADAAASPYPARLVAFLRALCEARPRLEVHILAWDSSPVFALERVPLQWLFFRVLGHPRIHHHLDHTHPRGASHHQKLVVIDRSVAFVGGMDVCTSRWDRRSHAAAAPLRRTRWRGYPPYHDVQAYVTGDAVDALRAWFHERWATAHGGAPLALDGVPRRAIELAPTLPLDAPAVGVARTRGRVDDPPIAPVRELYELHLRAIASAERVIYIENQYLSCDELRDALIRRMEARAAPPLEIVIVLPEKSPTFKERISIGIYQQRILASLGEAAARTGHHLGVYYSAVRDAAGHDVPVFVHAKVLAVDDRLLLVGSANLSNRSMGFDTELGLAWEAPAPSASLRAARVELLAEHCGLPSAAAEAVLGPASGLVDRLDALARAGEHRLRIHGRNVDERPGWLLSKLLPEDNPFDPDDPRSFREALPEPGAFLDRLLRDPLATLRGARRGKQQARDRARRQLEPG